MRFSLQTKSRQELGEQEAYLPSVAIALVKGHCERQSTYVKPDMLILGKAISGGVYPVSAVLADDSVMSVITPGTHGSTFGGNPLGSKVAHGSIEHIIRDEKLTQNARKLGNIFRDRMKALIEKTDIVTTSKRKGLLECSRHK